MEKLLIRLLRFPKTLLIAVLLISIVFFTLMKQNSRMETDLDKYMPQTHPSFVYSNQAEDWFNIQDGIIIAIENQNGIYNAATLQKVKDLTKQLQKMEEIAKDDVTSLYTADNIIGTESGLEVEPFFKRVPKSKSKLNKLRKSVRDNEMIFGRLVNTDETVTVIVAEIGDDSFCTKFLSSLIRLSQKIRRTRKTTCCRTTHCRRNYGLSGTA
jgi:uncharacterized protein